MLLILRGPGLRSPCSYSLQAGRFGDWILVGVTYSALVQTLPGAHPASCTISFPGVKRLGPPFDRPQPSSAEVTDGRSIPYFLSGPSRLWGELYPYTYRYTYEIWHSNSSQTCLHITIKCFQVKIAKLFSMLEFYDYIRQIVRNLRLSNMYFTKLTHDSNRRIDFRIKNLFNSILGSRFFQALSRFKLPHFLFTHLLLLLHLNVISFLVQFQLNFTSKALVFLLINAASY
jgi:hypothetical protein